ncbi:uncharacterized protein KY384_009192 [Bacidia gigantensis]|uniref:uncharacterized protein n=1 Tax=Bacidia gigantensis TaxID=2732470 RepID=UPI001D04A035|nr:uncharacterized protein KY384_009192 [Bacidia gigantensis]KAG8525548.1 hypothetical protein KY384_009192 [Bacidia gigantensis]
MTAQSEETNRLLSQILDSIKALDYNLQSQNKRLEDLEKVGPCSKEAAEGAPQARRVQSYKSTTEDDQDPFCFPEPHEVIHAYHALANGRTELGEQAKLWTAKIGDIWTLPRDHRIDLGFQRYMLEKLQGYDLAFRLEALQMFNNLLLDTETPLKPRSTKRRNWFRHLTVEDSFPNTPFWTHVYTIGRADSRELHKLGEDADSRPFEQQVPPSTAGRIIQHAPWQRLM